MLALRNPPKLRLMKGGRTSAFGNIKTKVASKHDRHVRVIASGIVERFAKLRASQIIIALSSETSIIGDYRFPCGFSLGNEGQSSAKSFLKRTSLRKEPVRTPKSRLSAEPNNPCSGQRPARERGLAVMSWRGAASRQLIPGVLWQKHNSLPASPISLSQCCDGAPGER